MGKTSKKTYTTPEIKKVELKPEEAVLTKCKQRPDPGCDANKKTSS